MARIAHLLTFADRGRACAWTATEQEARDLAAAAGRVVVSVETLPYPCRPRLDDAEGWGSGQIPSFCHRINPCRGKTACPGRPSCTE